MKILGISGSLRADSHNTALLRAAAGLLPEGVELELYEGLQDLPHYNPDGDGDAAPLAARTFRSAVEGADAVLFASPEFNGSVPGVLKNAIDWASRPVRAGALQGKTVAVIGASTGQYGALWAQGDLRRVLGVAGARVVPADLPVARAHEAFDADGNLLDPVIRERLQAHLASLVELASPVAIAV